MARDPNERRSSSIIEAAGDVPAGAVLPPEVKAAGIGTGNGQYYGYRVIYANGRSEFEWYKRGSGGGGDSPDPVEIRSEAPTAIDIKDAWDKGEEKEADSAKPPGGLPTRTINGQVFGWNPATRAYDIPTGQAPAATTPTQTAAPGGKPFIDDGPEARENGRRWGWNDQTRLYDRDLGPSPTAQEIIRNRSLPPDQDPRAETDAERAARGKETAARQEREAKEARANQPKDGRESIRGKDGKPYVKVTKVDPASGKSEVYYENEAGQRVPPPDEKPADIADPTDMPAPTFVVGDAAKDLTNFDIYLAGKIGTGPGKITQAKADQLRENRRKLWDIALTEQQGLVNTQKAEADRKGNERGQTLQDQGNRRSNATSIANQATSSLLPYMDKMGAGANGADFVAALRYLRDSSQDFVTSTGANAYVPNVTPGPALTTINNASIPAPGSAPAAPFLSPTRPAAAVAPAFTPQPMAPPPAGPSQAAAATAAAQAAQRGAAAAAPPVPAPVAAPSPGYNPGNAQQAADAGLVPGQNPYQWSPDDQPLAPAPLFNAKPPEQQTLPLLPPQPGSPAGGNVQMMPTAAPFLSMTRGPQQQAAYDPMPSVQSMIDDPEWDNEAVRQAFRELYGRDLPMSA